MDYYSSLIYGIVQGLTEFLPVSSSGHLGILPKLLNIHPPGVVFDLAMHVGTALAVSVYFKKDLKELFKSAIKLNFRRSTWNPGQLLAVNMILSTIVTVVFAFIIKDLAMTYRSVEIISFNLIGFGLLMWVSDLIGSKNVDSVMDKTGSGSKAILIGLSQVLALFPGVSRSGITLTAARFMNLSRDEASRYTFVLSLPLIIGGFIMKLPEFISSKQSFSISISLFGMFVSFIVGLLTIHLFLKIISKIGLSFFFNL